MVNPILLVILDGWGQREPADNNAISCAATPIWDQLWNSEVSTLLTCSGEDVGLPAGQMGNSEVGHMHMGAGRLLDQDLSRINKEIQNGKFDQNTVLADALMNLMSRKKKLHIIGLLSPGGVHSHQDHIVALIKAASKQGIEEIVLHLSLDGRDTPPKSAQSYIKKIENYISTVPSARIGSLIGRFYSMDRNANWDRTEKAYNLINEGLGTFSERSATDALEEAYRRGESDEFVSPTLICKNGKSGVQVDPDDLVIFSNFRADRARQLTEAFSQEGFKGFQRKSRINPKNFLTMTEYNKNFNLPVLYQPIELANTLGDVISDHGLKQLRIAETEKYAHVTFFFNGGIEVPATGEDRILVPSPNVTTYDERPEMSAREVTEKLLDAITSEKYDAIICNYANADMVGHTGNFSAAIKAIETLDDCLGKVIETSKNYNVDVLITADHGNVEQMTSEPSKVPHTAHTSNAVPAIYVGNRKAQAKIGSLVDIAPTLLSLMTIPIPEEMTGSPFIEVE
jgi:2,3-bisphosphoglycerate-independent phosphoglycerate mutase